MSYILDSNPNLTANGEAWRGKVEDAIGANIVVKERTGGIIHVEVSDNPNTGWQAVKGLYSLDAGKILIEGGSIAFKGRYYVDTRGHKYLRLNCTAVTGTLSTEVEVVWTGSPDDIATKVADNVKATGNANHGGAFQLSAQTSVVTAASNNGGVRLFNSPHSGYRASVINRSGKPITVYAPFEANIDGLASDVGVDVPAEDSKDFVSNDVGNWFSKGLFVGRAAPASPAPPPAASPPPPPPSKKWGLK